jgi:polysaccharide biosynthesis protein PslH
MNITIVNETLPYPPTAGNRIRTLNLMRRLASRHRLTYICRGDGAHDSSASRRAADFLQDHGIRLILADAGPTPRTGLKLLAALAANLASPLPYAVAAHRSSAVLRAAAQHAAKNPVDLWQFEWLAYADAPSQFSSAPRMVMAHNVESLIWRRYLDNEPNAFKRWFIRRQWRKFQAFEARVLGRADLVVAVSPDDAELLRSQFQVDRVAVIENGVDLDYFAPAKFPNSNPRQILFLGSLDWRPNQDSVRLLVDQIFPLVLALQPAARLCVAGRNPPPWLVRHCQCHRVELIANPPDVRPLLTQSGVMAVPLRIGGGSRLKILEAFACGLPVVSSTIGCEGLGLHHGGQLLIADSPDQMAAAIVQVMRDPASAMQMAERGRRLVRETHDWDRLADRLESLWEQCRSRKPQPDAPVSGDVEDWPSAVAN